MLHRLCFLLLSIIRLFVMIALVKLVVEYRPLSRAFRAICRLVKNHTTHSCSQHVPFTECFQMGQYRVQCARLPA